MGKLRKKVNVVSCRKSYTALNIDALNVVTQCSDCGNNFHILIKIFTTHWYSVLRSSCS